MTALAEPLTFERVFLEKVWGGRALASCPGLELPPDVPIGETWELVDREDQNSLVAGGSHGGRRLGELMDERGPELLGSAAPNRRGRFPLLVKYIDASQHLSVQVHPDDDSAVRLGGDAEGKTEAWYVLGVEPGACLWAGLRPDVTAEDFGRAAQAAAESKEAGDELVDMMLRWDVRPGDCVMVPGGTVHAIGAGITLVEVQQNSDTTYRIYDWGRMGLDGKPRETHVDQALRCVTFGAPEQPPARAELAPVAENLEGASLTRSAYFGVGELRVTGPARLATEGSFQIYAVRSGSGVLRSESNGGAREMTTGDVWLVPASAESVHVEPTGSELTLIHLS